MGNIEAPIIGKDALGRKVEDLSVVSWWGIDRKEIEWYPKIEYNKCSSCGLCFVTCGRRVFDWDIESVKPIVAHPYNCMVGCNTCAMLCPCEAIKFPDKSYLRKVTTKARVVKKALAIVNSIVLNSEKEKSKT